MLVSTVLCFGFKAFAESQLVHYFQNTPNTLGEMKTEMNSRSIRFKGEKISNLTQKDENNEFSNAS